MKLARDEDQSSKIGNTLKYIIKKCKQLKTAPKIETDQL